MKKIIWSNYNLDIKDWEDFFDECYPDADENERYEMMYETNNECLEDERVNLNIELPEDIIAIADLGLWNGRCCGYRKMSNNIRDCLYSECDYVEWYVDRYNNMRCEATHHDGTNHYLYRMWRNGLSDEQKENFLEKLWEDKATSKDITRCTKSLGKYIAKVYGW